MNLQSYRNATLNILQVLTASLTKLFHLIRCWSKFNVGNAQQAGDADSPYQPSKGPTQDSKAADQQKPHSPNCSLRPTSQQWPTAAKAMTPRCIPSRISSASGPRGCTRRTEVDSFPSTRIVLKTLTKAEYYNEGAMDLITYTSPVSSLFYSIHH